MNRKRKIGIVVAFGVAVVVAMALFWPSDKEPVRVTFVGPSTNRPSMLSFAIANRTTNRMLAGVGFQVVTNGAWSYEDGVSDGISQSIGPLSTSLFDTGIISTNRWKVVVRYTDPATYTALDRTRSKAGSYAYKHGWVRISLWIHPLNKVKRIFGPVMLGNKPAPPEQK